MNVLKTDEVGIGVDTPEDIERVEITMTDHQLCGFRWAVLDQPFRRVDKPGEFFDPVPEVIKALIEKQQTSVNTRCMDRLDQGVWINPM